MNLKAYFTEIWQEKNWWRAILLTGLISLIPLVGWIYVLGWLYEIFSWNHTPKGTRLPFKPTLSIFWNGLALTIRALICFIPFAMLILILSGVKELFITTTYGWLESIFVNLLDFLVRLSAFVGILTILLVFPVLVISQSQNRGLGGLFNFNHLLRSISQNLPMLSTFFVLAVISVFIGSLGGSFFMIGFIFTVPFAAAFYGNALGDLNLVTIE